MKAIKHIIMGLVLPVLVLSMTVPVFAADLPSGIPEGNLEQYIDSYVEGHKDTTAAMSVAVFTRDSILLEKTYGYINIEEKIENNSDVVIEWASITKLLVWVSVMQLEEEGRIDLNEDIRTYLPAGFLKKLKYEDPITMLHLMNHTPGWQVLAIGINVPEGEQIKELGDALIAYEPEQVFRPGEYTAYSNYGSALAGYIVELISGKPFYEYVHENIFAPLDMNNTALKPDLSDNQWVKERRGELVCYTTDLQNLGTSQFNAPLYPCGQAMGTLSDLRKFAQAILPDENGESVLFKKTGTLATMYTPTSYYPDGETARFYHGFWVKTGYQGNVIGHAGNSSCSSMLAIDPDAGIGAVVMTNQAMEGTYNYGMLYEVFGEKVFSGNGSLVDGDISGSYTISQSILKGILKITGHLGTVYITKAGEGTYIAPGYTFEYKEHGLYKMSMGDVIMLAYTDFDEDGQARILSVTPMDFIPLSQGSTTLGNVLLITFVVSGIYGLVSLIILLIARLRKKRQPLDGLQTAVYGSAFAALINLAVMFLFSATSRMGLTVNGILFILISIAVIACIITIIRKTRAFDLAKKQIRKLIIASVFGLIVVVNIIYWELWMFWV